MSFLSDLTHPRLTIVTGKGGVGKTSFALASALAMKERGMSVAYGNFYDGHFQFAESLGLLTLRLNVEECTREYLSKKLGTKFLADKILKISFFQAIFNILPGLTYIILVGKMIDELRQKPNLHIILDSPSSGHLLTLFESLKNFQDIFFAGMLFEDVRTILKFLSDPNLTKAHILSIPSWFSITEALELKQQLESLSIKEIPIILNNCLFPLLKDKEDLNLPEFLKEKFFMEKKIAKENEKIISFQIPHVLGESLKERIYQIKDVFFLGS